MVCCSAINCCLRTEDGVRLFRLPTDNETNKERRKAWLHNCKRKDVNKKMISICEFELKRQDGWVKLKHNAIPTIFNVDPTPRRSADRDAEEHDWSLLAVENAKRSDRVYKYRHILKEQLDEGSSMNLKEIVKKNREVVKKKKTTPNDSIVNSSDQESKKVTAQDNDVSVTITLNDETENEKISRLTKYVAELEENLHSLITENQNLVEENQLFRNFIKRLVKQL